MVRAGFRQSSDAGLLAASGVPTLIFGPSAPTVGHAPNEHVAIDDLAATARAVERIAWPVSFGP